MTRGRSATSLRRSALILGCVLDVAVPQGAVPASLTHQITYDLPADLPSALRALIGSLQVDAPVLAVDRHIPTVVAAPLQGPGWFDAVGCCLPTLHRRLLYPANRTCVKGATFAIDWLQERDGAPFEGDGSRNSQRFGFGARCWRSPTAPWSGSWTASPTSPPVPRRSWPPPRTSLATM